MKKNLISVLILALLVVNLVLTAILTITILPETKKSNELINQVCSAINLELKSGEGTDASTVPIDDIETYDIPDSMTIKLKRGDDGKDHYAVLTVQLSLNKGDPDYETYQPTLDTKQSLIKNEINTIVAEYTYDQIRDNQQQVQDAILKDLQKLFDSDFIVSVGFSSATYQ